MTVDRDDPNLRKIIESGPRKGQQEAYLVLSDEERAKGFVRPVRHSYVHLKCGTVTTMGSALSETCARNPKFYSGTFCCHCGTHFNLGPPWDPAFVWEPDGEPVGSNAEEAAQWNAEKKRKDAEKHAGSGI